MDVSCPTYGTDLVRFQLFPKKSLQDTPKMVKKYLGKPEQIWNILDITRTYLLAGFFWKSNFSSFFVYEAKFFRAKCVEQFSYF